MQRETIMVRFFGPCLLLFAVATAVFAQGNKHQDSVRTRIEKEVIACLDARTEAGLKRDVATLERLYSEDYFHTNPDGSIMRRPQVLASYKAAPTAVIDSA